MKHTLNIFYITIPLSGEKIANPIGITKQTVSRKLSNLQSENIIDILENKSLLIKNIDILKELSEI